MRNKEKGFTLAELLIVVAIIGVLVAISIPIFTSQLEKSREATDLANVRAAYAEVMAAAIIEDKTSPYYVDNRWETVVNLKQKSDGWAIKTPITVGGITSDTDGGTNSDSTWIGLPSSLGICKISCNEQGSVVINWGSTSQPDDNDNSSPIYNITEINDISKYNGTLKYGTVYRINGKDYIFQWKESYTVDEYREFPGINNAFQMIHADAKIFTPSDYTEGQECELVRNGDLYQDETGLYVRVYNESTWWSTPDKQPGNWIKINQ